MDAGEQQHFDRILLPQLPAPRVFGSLFKAGARDALGIRKPARRGERPEQLLPGGQLPQHDVGQHLQKTVGGGGRFAGRRDQFDLALGPLRRDVGIVVLAAERSRMDRFGEHAAGRAAQAFAFDSDPAVRTAPQQGAPRTED